MGSGMMILSDSLRQATQLQTCVSPTHSNVLHVDLAFSFLYMTGYVACRCRVLNWEALRQPIIYIC